MLTSKRRKVARHPRRVVDAVIPDLEADAQELAVRHGASRGILLKASLHLVNERVLFDSITQRQGWQLLRKAQGQRVHRA